MFHDWIILRHYFHSNDVNLYLNIIVFNLKVYIVYYIPRELFSFIYSFKRNIQFQFAC